MRRRKQKTTEPYVVTSICLTDDERTTLKHNANLRGMSASAYVRYVLNLADELQHLKDKLEAGN